MKTYKNLYPQIISFDNLYEAWRKARRGKRYKPSAATFEQNLAAELLTLHRELGEETWQPGGYRSFTIHEPKRRKISAAPFRDRVVHHALVRSAYWQPNLAVLGGCLSESVRSIRQTHAPLQRLCSLCR
jgi:hypothetical protein